MMPSSLPLKSWKPADALANQFRVSQSQTLPYDAYFTRKSVLQVAGGAARFTFFQLCKALVGAADYQVLRVPLAADESLLETNASPATCDHHSGAHLQQILTCSRVVSAGDRAALPHHFRDRRPVAVTCGT